MLRFPVPGAPLTPTDNERTHMKPLIRILEKGGIRWGIGCADWLTSLVADGIIGGVGALIAKFAGASTLGTSS